MSPSVPVRSNNWLTLGCIIAFCIALLLLSDRIEPTAALPKLEVITKIVKDLIVVPATSCQDALVQ